MNLDTILPRLTERRASQLVEFTARLEAAVAAQIVPNTLFTEAKWIINSSVDWAEKSYQTETRFYGDVLVMGAYNVPAALKEATKKKLNARIAFLTALLPLHELLQSAKPFIVKRGDMPKVKTPKQLAKEAKAMTCQCCARQIFAETGLIAHHGYERPGYGYQTASCMGARNLPFEVSREVLGDLIVSLWNWHARDTQARAAIEGERLAIRMDVQDRSVKRDVYGRYPTITIEVTRANFADHAPVLSRQRGILDFDALKQAELDRRALAIKNLYDDIVAQQARYDGWKQTHTWSDEKWVAL